MINKYIGITLFAITSFIAVVLADRQFPSWFAAKLGPVDKILVDKTARTMVLLREGKELARYPIAIGKNPVGHKQVEGDSRTPEGAYIIDWRNPNSRFYKSLHISYPNEQDKRHAFELHQSPGGDIMIHGLPNGLSVFQKFLYRRDWTDGCIAVNDRQMEEIWHAVADGTKIEILP